MIENEKFITTFDKFFKYFGEEAQMRMCIEEMSELTKELCKYMRFSNIDSESNNSNLLKIKDNIIEETADVLICAWQMMELFGKNEVEDMMNYKIERGRKFVDDYIANHNLGDK